MLLESLEKFQRTWESEKVTDDERKNRDYLEHSTAKISEDTEKSQRKLKSLIYC